MKPGRIRTTRASSADKLAQASSVVCHALAVGRRIERRLIAAEIERKLATAEAPRELTPAALSSWRGHVDAIAARARFGDQTSYRRYAPIDKTARRLFDLLEQNRVEALAARAFPGMRLNLAALAHEKWSRAQPEGAIRGIGTGWVDTFALLARFPLGAPMPEGAVRALGSSWRVWMEPEIAASLDTLGGRLDDAEAFARQSLQIISVLELSESDPTALRKFHGGVTKPSDKTSTAHARPLEGVADSSEARLRQAVEERASERSSEADRSSPDEPEPADRSYAAYTTEFDRVSRPGDLRDAATLARRRRELDEHERARAAGVTRWAHRLQRRLLARQLRSWNFDLEEGVIDASRLARVVTRPTEPAAYKQESEIEFPDTVVSLLVDNSGSMRGESIADAAGCAEILGRVLERCGVKTEVLGFTTRTWQGGHARRKWIAAGRPSWPGRIADLQHIVYKSADEPWRRARATLGLMLEDDLLKENIDGEALSWAAARLRRRPEPRRILVVISDGAPLDEATAAANDQGFLDRHLRAVIEGLERSSSIELLAIGIGHDVSRYYHRAMTLASVEHMGEALVQQFIDVLANPMHGSQPRVHRKPTAPKSGDTLQ